METTPSLHEGYDSDALRDALASVEPWDGVELSELFTLETSDDCEHDENARRVDKLTPYKPRRVPRKQETLALQNKVASLRRILESERAKRELLRGTGSDDGLANEWREIAARQADQRTASLVENEKLRLVVASQASAARKIVRLGERVAQIEEMLPRAPATSIDQYRGPDPDPLDQLEELGRTIQDTKDVFCADEFSAQGLESFGTAHFRSCDPESLEGVELEYLMGWTLPFSLGDVADALWIQATRPPAMNKAVLSVVLHKEPRARVSRFLAPPMEGQNVSFAHGQTASRRSQPSEADGSIELCTNIRARVINAQKNKEVVLSGHEWIRVEPLELTDAAHGPLSRVQWCHRMRVRPQTYESMTPKERAEWIHSVVTGPVQSRVERDLTRNIQSIENLLLTPRDLTGDH